MARRAASIWRLVIQAGSSVIRPYSPKAIEVPPLAVPLMRPRMTLRCLTRLGISMATPLPPRHLRTAQAAGDVDLHALRAGLHGALHGLLHGLLEGDATRQLLRDVGGHEDGVKLPLADLLDLERDLARGQAADLLAQGLDVRPALADDDARLGGMDGDRHVVDAALDLHAADARVGEPASDQLPDGDVLLEEGGVALPGIPLGVPRPRDAEAEAVRVDLVTHRLVLPVLDDDGDVRHRLVDGEGAALGARPPALDGRTFVGHRVGDEQVFGGEVVGGVGGRRGALEHLGGGGALHVRRLLQRCRALGVLAVPAVAAGGADLTEPVPDHVLRHVDGDVLPAVVDGGGVPDEVRDDDALPRPGLDAPL